MASGIYDNFKNVVMSTGILSSATLYVALVTSGYTPNFGTHIHFSDITNEVVGTGYTAGGQVLTGVSYSTDSTNNLGIMKANNPVWSAAIFTARGAVIYVHTGVSTTSTLVAYVDFATDQTTNNQSFTVQWSTSGILFLS